jgi:outer membrane protein OmpA-like peptidoglycan-associated protein
MNRLLALSATLALLGACASNPAAQKAAAAPLPWCNPCPYPCDSPCGAVAAAPAAPAAPKYVPPATPAISAAFDPAPGEYKDPQSVTLSSPTPGAVIHYTTDGSTPTESSPAYSAPIAVDRATTIRALVAAPNVPESSVSEGVYAIAPPAAAAEPQPTTPPEAPKVTVTEKKIELHEKVYFDSSKTTIKPVSFPLLDEVAKVLGEHQEVKKVLVEGHTDNSGAAAFNTSLSQGRAQAVRDYLVKKGVAPERLDAKGFGSSKPIADNKTAAGREANRRVELTIE